LGFKGVLRQLGSTAKTAEDQVLKTLAIGLGLRDIMRVVELEQDAIPNGMPEWVVGSPLGIEDAEKLLECASLGPLGDR
jgi:hypothetical protein